MPHHKSAKKRVRQTTSRSAANKSVTSAARTVIKKVREAIVAKDKDLASKLLLEAQTHLARLAKRGIIKANNAARRTSRLALQVNKL